jgi:hypothetical protein
VMVDITATDVLRRQKEKANDIWDALEVNRGEEYEHVIVKDIK